MSIRLSIFSIILFLSSTVSAQQDFTAFVFDADTPDLAIYQASVEVFEDNKSLITIKTYFDGSFRMKLNKNKLYTFVISQPGYTDQTIDVRSDKAGVPDKNGVKLYMKKDGLRLTGLLRDRETSLPVSGGIITIRNIQTRKEDQITTDKSGEYNFKLEYETNYRVFVDRRSPGLFNRYKDTTFYVSTVGFNMPLNYRLDIYLDKAERLEKERVGYNPQPNKTNLKPVLEVKGDADSLQAKKAGKEKKDKQQLPEIPEETMQEAALVEAAKPKAEPPNVELPKADVNEKARKTKTANKNNIDTAIQPVQPTPPSTPQASEPPKATKKTPKKASKEKAVGGEGKSPSAATEPHQSAQSKTDVDAVREAKARKEKPAKKPKKGGANPVNTTPDTEVILYPARVEGVVSDADNGVPLFNVKVRVEDINGNYLYTAPTDESGKFMLAFTREGRYRLAFSKFKFDAKSDTITVAAFRYDTTLSFRYKLSEPREANPSAWLPAVTFTKNSDKLSTETQNKLSALAVGMLENPFARLKLYGLAAHDESSATLLVEKRLIEVVKYLAQIGVNPQRVKTYNDGASRTINNCGKGSKCPEALLKVNRTVQYELIKE